MKLKFQTILIITVLLLSDNVLSIKPAQAIGEPTSWSYVLEGVPPYNESFVGDTVNGSLKILKTSRPYSNFSFIFEQKNIDDFSEYGDYVRNIETVNISIVLNITVGDKGFIYVDKEGLYERGHNRNVDVYFDLNMDYMLGDNLTNFNKSFDYSNKLEEEDWKFNNQDDDEGQELTKNQFTVYKSGEDDDDNFNKFEFENYIDIDDETSNNKTITNIDMLFSHIEKNNSDLVVYNTINFASNSVEIFFDEDNNIRFDITNNTSELEIPFKEIITGENDFLPTNISQVSNLVYNFNETKENEVKSLRAKPIMDVSIHPSNYERTPKVTVPNVTTPNNDTSSPILNLLDLNFDIKNVAKSYTTEIIIVVVMIILIITAIYIKKNYTFKQD